MIRFYVDSADRREVEPLLAGGLLAGVTTNPTLLQAAGVRAEGIPDLVTWATAAGAGTVFVQAWGADAAELERRGRELAKLSDAVAVKIPATRDGLTATARLTADGVRVLVTAVYSAVQVLPAIAADATYLAPYLGRMNDAGRDGPGEIAAMQHVVAASGSRLRILVASLRSPEDALRLAEVGVQDFTLAPAVLARFFDDDLTAAAVRTFDEASAAGE
jgi:TalC/MipB family fructose-6-phosphate aldolase